MFITVFLLQSALRCVNVTSVILSEAKDLSVRQAEAKILRFAQNDRDCESVQKPWKPPPASEEARCVPFPRFVQAPRKLHIRSLLLPFRFKPASLGFESVSKSREAAPEEAASAAHTARVRRSSLRSVSAVCVSAAKTPHSLPPSSFPIQTHCVGL